MANKPALTGLEAIKFMEQGGMVFYKNESTLEVILNKIENDVLYWCQDYELEDNLWKVDDSFNFNLLYEEYVEPKPLTGWERASNKHDEYFCIGHCGDIRPYSDDFLGYDRTIYNIANYFSMKEKAEEINFKQTLFRKLQRFSDENGGDKIDWKDEDQCKYHIKYTHYYNKIYVEGNHSLQEVGVVYFINEQITEQAIELFHDDLIKYFTTHD